MAIEYMSLEDVMRELQIDEYEVKKLVSQGELRGFRDGLSMVFRRDEVLALKQSRETDPTIILTDSDQEMGIAEKSDELILEDDDSSDTIINIGDIMGGMNGEQSPSDSFDPFAGPVLESPFAVPSANPFAGPVLESPFAVPSAVDTGLVALDDNLGMATTSFAPMADSAEDNPRARGGRSMFRRYWGVEMIQDGTAAAIVLAIAFCFVDSSSYLLKLKWTAIILATVTFLVCVGILVKRRGWPAAGRSALKSTALVACVSIIPILTIAAAFVLPDRFVHRKIDPTEGVIDNLQVQIASIAEKRIEFERRNEMLQREVGEKARALDERNRALASLLQRLGFADTERDDLDDLWNGVFRLKLDGRDKTTGLDEANKRLAGILRDNDFVDSDGEDFYDLQLGLKGLGLTIQALQQEVERIRLERNELAGQKGRLDLRSDFLERQLAVARGWIYRDAVCAIGIRSEKGNHFVDLSVRGAETIAVKIGANKAAAMTALATKIAPDAFHNSWGTVTIEIGTKDEATIIFEASDGAGDLIQFSPEETSFVADEDTPTMECTLDLVEGRVVARRP